MQLCSASGPARNSHDADEKIPFQASDQAKKMGSFDSLPCATRKAISLRMTV